MTDQATTIAELHKMRRRKRRTIAAAVAHKLTGVEAIRRAQAGEEIRLDLETGDLTVMATTEPTAGAGALEARKVRNAKRFVIGIDPGVKTGFAVWDREKRTFFEVETLSFWEVFDRVQHGAFYQRNDVLLIIEVAHYAPVFRERKAKGQNANHAARLAQNVGQVMREAKLLVEGFRRLGYEVVEQKPLGKAKNAADDRRQFERLTGWTERTSQHARDAARICFGA